MMPFAKKKISPRSPKELVSAGRVCTGIQKRATPKPATIQIAACGPAAPCLFRAYLEIFPRLCGPPAIDREFKTIDFLTLIDLRHLPGRVRASFF
jgi:putative hemolysin